MELCRKCKQEMAFVGSYHAVPEYQCRNAGCESFGQTVEVWQVATMTAKEARTEVEALVGKEWLKEFDRKQAAVAVSA